MAQNEFTAPAVTGHMDGTPDYVLWFLTLRSRDEQARDRAILQLRGIRERCRTEKDKHLIDQIVAALQRALLIPHYPDM